MTTLSAGHLLDDADCQHLGYIPPFPPCFSYFFAIIPRYPEKHDNFRPVISYGLSGLSGFWVEYRGHDNLTALDCDGHGIDNRDCDGHGIGC